MIARSSAWPSEAEQRRFSKPVALSPRFTAWARSHGYEIVPDGPVRTVINAPSDYSDWVIWPTPDALGLWAVGYRYPGGRVSRLFDIADGDDMERVLYYLIGERFRFQQIGMRAVEYPARWATGWSRAPARFPGAPDELIDPDGAVRYRAHIPGSWHPRVLSHILQMNPRRVARSYDRQPRMSLRRLPGRRLGLVGVRAVLVVALLGAVIYWATNAGDSVLTVTLFVVTAPLVVAAPAIASAGMVLGAVDERARVRGRALWWTVAAVAGSGLAAEVAAMWLAYTARGTTWFYPVAAAAAALVAASIAVAIGTLVDR